jgi:heterodisulfide reductase subunit A-like polyferredoxin
MINNLIIAGCNFIGLYSAIKCIDNGYDVTIIEKKNSYNDKRNYYRIFNKNHVSYINLLNKFSISYSKYSLKYNEKTYNILFNIINKSKMIPKNH